MAQFVDVTACSALQLAGLIRRREVTAVEVLEAHIARLAVTEPKVNGIVAYRYTAAREAARAADARIAAAAAGEELPPLLGVPCTIKESLAVEGMPHTAGFRPAVGRIAARNAPAVERLVGAGAIPIGVTNTSELCLWIEARNQVYGDSNNPYDVTRTVGGSSGGEGAVIGSGGVPFGLGSDLAGSIRVPAFCCGVFGHKPSVGAVPTSGHFPVGAGHSRRMMVVGPLARRAEDLYPLMQILNWDDPDDPYDREIPLGDPADVSIEGLRVVIPTGLGVSVGTSAELLRVREEAARHLAARGANVVRVSARGMVRVQSLFIEALRRAWDEEFEQSVGWENTGLRELYRDMRGPDPAHTRAFVNLATLVRVSSKLIPSPPDRYVNRQVDRLAQSFAEVIGDGVMLVPPMPRAAPPHGWTTLRPWAMETEIIANLFGWPATQIPMGFGYDGLPLGVQALAPMDQDHKTIAVAIALEQQFGGWVAPENAPGPPAPAVRRGRVISGTMLTARSAARRPLRARRGRPAAHRPSVR